MEASRAVLLALAQMTTAPLDPHVKSLAQEQNRPWRGSRSGQR